MQAVLVTLKVVQINAFALRCREIDKRMLPNPRIKDNCFFFCVDVGLSMRSSFKKLAAIRR